MKIIEKTSLLNKYLDSPPYTDYFHANVRQYTQLAEYDAGEYILRQEVPPEYLYLMVLGRCCVRVPLANGKSVILQTLKAPCLIGEMELFENISPFTVQALERCRMLTVPLNPCRTYLLGDAYFLRRLCSVLISKERTEALTLIHAFGYPLEKRLAKFILDNRQGNCFYIKKVLIAESLGVSYRHVEKVMHDFVEKGYLTKKKLVYTIVGQAALTSLAQELDPSGLIGFPENG